MSVGRNYLRSKATRKAPARGAIVGVLLVFSVAILLWTSLGKSADARLETPPPVTSTAPKEDVVTGGTATPPVQPFILTDEDREDVLLVRPNWRRGARSLNDTEPIRIFIGIISDRMDRQACSAVASAYLSGLPITVVGYQYRDSEGWANYKKQGIALRAMRQAGLKGKDVVFIADKDVVFSNGADLVHALDRFIMHSPESASELDAWAVRQSLEGAMAPFIISGEQNCYIPLLFPPDVTATCPEDALTLGVGTFDRYAQLLFGSNYTPLANRTVTHVNSGTMVARMWAYEELIDAFYKYHDAMSRTLEGAAKKLWKTCDQSLVAGIYGALLAWEASIDMLAPEKRGQVADIRGPFGMRAGLLSLDFMNEFAHVYVAQRPNPFFTTNDALWNPRAKSAFLSKMARRIQSFSVSFPSRGCSPVAEVDHTYLDSQLIATEREPTVGRDFPFANIQPKVSRCRLAALYRANADAGGEMTDNITACADTALDTSREGPWEGGALPALFDHPLHRSRDGSIKSIRMAPPVVAFKPLKDPNSDARGFPAFLHYAGLMKDRALPNLLLYLGWSLPIVFDHLPKNHSESAASRAKRYLRSMPLELWTTKERQHGSFNDMCMHHLGHFPW